MTATKCCTSWLGHKFEARHSTFSPCSINMAEGERITPDIIRAANLYRAYEGDVCTRCGCIVNRPTPSKEQ